MCASLVMAKVRFSHLAPEMLGDDDPLSLCMKKYVWKYLTLQIPS